MTIKGHPRQSSVKVQFLVWCGFEVETVLGIWCYSQNLLKRLIQYKNG